MIEPFNQARDRLERQYANVRFDPASGWSGEELRAALARHLADSPGEPRILTKAWLLQLLCNRARIASEPGDPFVGKLEHHGLLHAVRRTWWKEEGEREFRDEQPGLQGAWSAQLDCASHICPDWARLMREGCAGLRDAAGGRPGVFHEAVAMAFNALITLIDRFNVLQPHPALAALAERPPGTLHQALQLAYIYHELLELDGMQVRSMGRFDVLYREFFRRDIRAGRLDQDQAKELLKYFWIKFYAKTQGRLFGKPFLCGPDSDEFSRLVMEAFHEMRTVDPKFHVRVAEHTAQDYLEQVVRCIQDGCTSMVVVNNDRQVEMLRRKGRSAEDASDYVLIGCYEPAVQGKELNCSGAATLNLAKGVEQILASGEYASFRELMTAYLGILGTNISDLTDRVRRWERLWPAISPTPLLSGTMGSCCETGRDISEAGAVYNTSGVCCIGIADAVDSLAVLEHLVYTEKLCSLTELKTALRVNWDGFEELRTIARNRVPKWGNNDSRVDRLAVEITEFLGTRINREPNARGGMFQAALFGILPVVQAFGACTGALPNGRRTGESLAINTGSGLGLDTNGITSLINSVTRIDLAKFPNGTVLDVMFHPSAVIGEEGVHTIISIIRGHFAQGGMAIQFNIFDADTLREAQREPKRHANLQVRVCGWNARFTDLCPEDQDMFIARAEASAAARR